MSLRDKLRQVVGARLKPCTVGPGTDYPSFRPANCDLVTASGRHCAATIHPGCNIPLVPAHTPWTQVERNARYDPTEPAAAFVTLPSGVGEEDRNYCASIQDLQKYVQDPYCGALVVEKKKLLHLIRKTQAAAEERAAEAEGRTFKAAAARKLVRHIAHKNEQQLTKLARLAS